ncbi:hypothetical protein [Salinibaculum rarum]|uniref:hypothetical protein n=1 Tax=Salinibaculum rarum TaxID=3058903 RepID=UPI00265DDB52|nr:hypothetical protein [Salinibaculum sp. KK48]
MTEAIKQALRVARHAVVDLYLAGGNGRIYWPYRLQPARQGDTTPSVRRKSTKYILDSGLDDDITNEDLLRWAEERDPDYIIPNDEVRDGDTSSEEAITTTAERVASFLDSVEERDLNATVLVPLQPPYPEHYKHLIEEYPRQARRRHFALGGLKAATPEQQLEHIYSFRESVGWDAYAHGFGLGFSKPLIKALRDDPGLLDSVDASTVQQHANSGEIAGTSRKPVYVGPATGDEVATVTSHYIGAEMTDVARMLAPSITDDDEIEANWEKLNVPTPDHIDTTAESVSETQETFSSFAQSASDTDD